MSVCSVPKRLLLAALADRLQTLPPPLLCRHEPRRRRPRSSAALVDGARRRAAARHLRAAASATAPSPCSRCRRPASSGARSSRQRCHRSSSRSSSGKSLDGSKAKLRQLPGRLRMCSKRRQWSCVGRPRLAPWARMAPQPTLEASSAWRSTMCQACDANARPRPSSSRRCHCRRCSRRHPRRLGPCLLLLLLLRLQRSSRLLARARLRRAGQLRMQTCQMQRLPRVVALAACQRLPLLRQLQAWKEVAASGAGGKLVAASSRSRPRRSSRSRGPSRSQRRPQRT